MCEKTNLGPMVVVAAYVVMALAGGSAAADPAEQAKRILEATGVKGGLIVHVGCGDGKLTAALRANESYLVHGLARQAQNVAAARRHVHSMGLYGKVSIDRLWSARLPYVDNLVNLVVCEDPGSVPMAEVLRVLAPGGVAYIKGSVTRKPRPGAIDEWTHWLHDATGNAVAHDTVVGPPRRMQWVGSPRWARHHDRMASMTALVSSGGRIFYIFDEGPTASIMAPPKRSLIARDAFNGTVLWKRAIPVWHAHLWPFKSGPAQLQRRLVAVGNTVYVTLGLYAPLTALEAATGETIRTYEHSKGTEEVIASEGVLFLLVNTSAKKPKKFTPVHRGIGEAKKRVADEWPWDQVKRWIVAVRADSGQVLWKQQRRVVPMTMAADGRAVYFHDGKSIVCLDRTRGGQTWRSSPIARRSPIHTNFGPTLVVHKDVVLFAGGTQFMTALSAATGKTLWMRPHRRGGHNSPEDLLVVDGLVWSGTIAGGRDSGVFTGRDLHTGEVKREFPPDVKTHWFHHRCYRAKATDKYLLPSRTGIEFVDVRTKHWETHHWVRGGCIYGIMPANGLIYAPPHSCGCYLDAKLSGFCALAPAFAPPSPRLRRATAGLPADDERVEKGPAYAKASAFAKASSDKSAGKPADAEASADWPTYRHDGTRSGFTKASVPAQLEPAWRRHIGGKLSSVVVAEGKLLVASIETHTVHALDAATGKPAWSYTAGGRVDSPPTIHEGLALFGSADGWVYCLRADDGKLAWRFRAAPQDRRLTSYEQVESVWPVHGSVLVRNGIVYCVAGRSMFLDGGLRLLRLEARTGRKLGETVLDDRDPATGKNLQVHVKGLNMATALPDVLSGEGQSVYMRTQRFDLEGRRVGIGPTDPSKQQGPGAHLFSPTGFLDGEYWHRTYWIYGKSIASGAGGWYRAGRYAPAGRMLVFDESNVYGYGRRPEYYRWSTPLRYHLFAVDKAPKFVRPEPGRRGAAPKTPKKQKKQKQQKKKRRVQMPAKPVYHWSRQAPLHVRALVLADKTLFAAGPPAVVDEEEAFDKIGEADTRAKLQEHGEAFTGGKGGLLVAASAVDGKELAHYSLESMPVWDGLAAAAGKLYLATVDGKVICMGGK